MAKWSNDHASLLALSPTMFTHAVSASDLIWPRRGHWGVRWPKGQKKRAAASAGRGGRPEFCRVFSLSLAFQFLVSLCRLEPWIQTGTSGYSTTLKRLCSIVLVVGFSLDTGFLTWLGNGTEKAKVQHRKVDYDKHTLLYFLCFGGFCTARQNFQFGEKASWVE